MQKNLFKVFGAIAIASLLASCAQPYPNQDGDSHDESSVEVLPDIDDKSVQVLQDIDDGEVQVLEDANLTAPVADCNLDGLSQSNKSILLALNGYYRAALIGKESAYNATLKRLIDDKGGDANEVDPKTKATPLTIAVQANDRAMINRLCKVGANANAKTLNNLPLITLALQEGALDGAKALLACAANPNASDPNLPTPLTVATLGGITSLEYRSMALELADRGADPNQGSIGSQTLLLYAIKTSQTELALKMIQKGANINLADENGMPPLSWALLLKEDKVAEALVAKGAKAEAIDAYGYTPLNWAIFTDNSGAVRKLAGADYKPIESERGAMAAQIAKTRSLAELRAMLQGQSVSSAAIAAPNIIAFRDMPFLKIEYRGSTISVKTTDKLLRADMLKKPARLVLDFERFEGATGATVTIGDSAVFKRVSTGRHDGFYRVVVQLDREHIYDLARNADGYSVILR